MRKFKNISFVLLLSSIFLQPVSNSFASPTGCPDTWSIPINLMDATDEQINKLWAQDFSTVITPSRDSQYSFDGVNWITVKNGFVNIKAPSNQNQRNYDVGVLINYFGSRWDDITLIRLGDLSWLLKPIIYLKTSITVEKQGCGNPTKFYYQKQYTPPGIETLSFESEILKIKEKFRNYQVFEATAKIYDGCVTRWQDLSKSSQLRKPLDFCFLWTSGAPDGMLINLIPDEPNCLELLPGNSNTATTVGVKPGTNCKYTIMGFTGENYLNNKDYPNFSVIPNHYNPLTDKLVSFGKISINSKSGVLKLECVKGKLTKKVTGTNPKCPSGYKKA